MGLVRKIKAGLVKVSVNDFVGEDGNVFFDVEDGIMRLSDGSTPGGIPLSSGGAEGGASTFRQLLDTPSSFSGTGGYFVKVNPQASALEFVNVNLFDGDYSSLTNTPTLFDPSDITQTLLPRTSESIDLGSTTKKWRDLYLSGNTIYLGDAEIARNSTGGIDLPAGSRVNGVTIGSGGVTSYNDLTDTPTIPSDVSDLTDTNGLLGGGGGGSYTLPIASNSTLGGIKIGSGLSINGSGVLSVTAVGVTSYNDLTDTPTIPSDISQLTDTTNLLVHFSGNYNDLTNKPTIPTTLSSLTNDSGYITGYTVTQADVTQHQSALTITESQISDFGTYEPADASILKSSAIGVTVQAYNANTVIDSNYAHITITSTSVSDGTTTFNQYNDTALSGRVTSLENAGYITGYTVTQADVTQHQSALIITESQISDLQTYLTSVAFADLTSTPTTLLGYGITDAATSVQGTKADTALQPNTAFDVKGSVFADDSTLLVDAVNASIPYGVLSGVPTTVSGFGITDVYTKTETDSAVSTAVSNLIGDAPAVLDTLAELADAIGDDANFLTTLNNSIALKANTADLAAVATSGSYNDLADKPDVSDLSDSNGLLAAASGITEDDAITYSIIFG